MDSTNKLGYILILWVLLVVLVSMVGLEDVTRTILLFFLLGIGSWLLGYMAGLKRYLQVSFLIYVVSTSVMLHTTVKPPSTHNLYVILVYIPILVYAIYAWLKRPRPS